MITIRVGKTSEIETPKEAEKFIRDHVVVKRRDLLRIAKLARKHGIYEELRALKMDMHDLSIAEGGDW